MMVRASEAVLITGAAGFGGSGLTKALLGLGYEVTGLDVVPPAHASLLWREVSNPRFHYLWKSIQDVQPGDVEGHSIIVHLAAQPDVPAAPVRQPPARVRFAPRWHAVGRTEHLLINGPRFLSAVPPVDPALA